MKLIPGFLIIATVTLLKSSSAEVAPGVKTIMLNAIKNCAEESKIPEEILAKVQKHEPTGDASVKCFRVCVMDKFGLMTDDNKINKEKMLEGGQMIGAITDENLVEAKQVLNDCSSQYSGNDRCEAANVFCDCIYKAKGVAVMSVP